MVSNKDPETACKPLSKRKVATWPQGGIMASGLFRAPCVGFGGGFWALRFMKGL